MGLSQSYTNLQKEHKLTNSAEDVSLAWRDVLPKVRRVSMAIWQRSSSAELHSNTTASMLSTAWK